VRCTLQLLAEKAKEQAPVPAPALGPPPVPTPPPAEAQPAPNQAATPVMQLDPSTAWKLEKMELQVLTFALLLFWMYKGCCCLISLHSSCHVYRKHVTMKTALMLACAVLTKRHGLRLQLYLCSPRCNCVHMVEHHMHRICHGESYPPQTGQSWDQQLLAGSGAATHMAVMFEWHVHTHFCCMWQAKDMKEEREGLLQDIAKLKAALQQLAARHQGMLYTYPHGQILIQVAHDGLGQTERMYHD